MKILHFVHLVACIIIPVSIINSGYAVNNISNDNKNSLEDTGYPNPILKICSNNTDNAALNSYTRIHKNKLGNVHNNNNVLNEYNFKNDINTKYEKLMIEIVEVSKLVSSNNRNISTKEIINIINNIFDDINNKNKNITIMSLKNICNKYDKSNTIYNNIVDSNIFTEYEVVKLIKNLSSYFSKGTYCRKEIENIDNITSDLKSKIDKMISQIINGDNKYNGAEVKVVVNKDLDKRNKLEAERQELILKYNNDKNEMLKLLNVNYNVNSENFVKNILKDLYNKQNNEMTTLYGILTNTKYTNSNTCCNIYDNIVYKGLDYSHKIVTCLENILKIKEELMQMWNKFKNNIK